MNESACPTGQTSPIEAGEPLTLLSPAEPSAWNKRAGRELPTSAAKSIAWVDGRPVKAGDYNLGWRVLHRAVSVRDADSFFTAVLDAMARGKECMVLGRLRDAPEVHKFQAESGHVLRRQSADKHELVFFEEFPRRGFMVDFDPTPAILDWCRQQGLDVFTEPAAAVRACMDEFFPVALRDSRCLWMLSNSAGLEAEHAVKFHAFFWIAGPVLPTEFKTFVVDAAAQAKQRGFGELNKAGHEKQSCGLDPALYSATQPHFIAAPAVTGGPDPLPVRHGFFTGEECTLRVEDMTQQLKLKGAVPRVDKPQRVIVGKQACTAVDQRQRAEIDGHYSAYDWRQCLEFLGADKDSFHVPLLKATAALARAAVRDGVLSLDMTMAAMRTAIAPTLSEMAARVWAANPGDHSAGRLQEYLDDLPRMTLDYALPRLRRRQVECRRTCPPQFPDPGMPKEAALAATAEVADGHFKLALQMHEARKAEFLAFKDWKEGEPWPGVVGSFPATVLAASMGLGKSRANLRSLLKNVDLAHWRYFLFVPSHEIAQQVVAEYDEQLTELRKELGRDFGKEFPEPFVFQGRERLCETEDGATKEKLKLAKQFGHSATRTVCRTCPLHPRNGGACAYIAQDYEHGPGLKVFVHSYLGMGSLPSAPPQHLNPTNYWDADAVADGSAPIFGVTIDEAFWSTLLCGATEKSKDKSTEEMEGGNPEGASGEKWTRRVGWLLDNAEALVPGGDQEQLWEMRKLLANLGSALKQCQKVGGGRVTREMLVSAGLWSADGNSQLSNWLPMVTGLHSLFRQRAEDLAEKNGFSDSKVVKAREARDRLEVMLWLLRILHWQHRDRPAPIGIEVVGDSVRLRFSKETPPWLNDLPLLVLDGTATEVFSRDTLSLRDYNTGTARSFFNLDFIRVRVEDLGGYRVKVIGAPTSHSSLADKALKAIARRFEKAEAAGLVPKEDRIRRDDAAEQLYRAVRAVVDRVPPNLDGSPSVGLVLPKTTEFYYEGNRMLPPNVALGHHGDTRGKNLWKNVSLFVTAGRAQPAPQALESMAEARATFSPRVPVLALTGNLVKVERGLRVRDGAGYKGVPATTCESPDLFIQEVQDQLVRAEVEQTAERTRGMHRKPGDEFLSLHFDNVCTDQTFDAVVDWAAFAVNEAGALLHGRGLVPNRPVDLVEVGRAVLGDTQSGGLFTGNNQARHVLRAGAGLERDELGQNHSENVAGAGITKSGGDPISIPPHSPSAASRIDIYNSSIVASLRLLTFAPVWVHWGFPEAHPLLEPPKLARAALSIRQCADAEVLVDPERVNTVEAVRRLLSRNVTDIELGAAFELPRPAPTLPSPTVGYSGTDWAPEPEDGSDHWEPSDSDVEDSWEPEDFDPFDDTEGLEPEYGEPDDNWAPAESDDDFEPSWEESSP